MGKSLKTFYTDHDGDGFYDDPIEILVEDHPRPTPPLPPSPQNPKTFGAPSSYPYVEKLKETALKYLPIILIVMFILGTLLSFILPIFNHFIG